MPYPPTARTRSRLGVELLEPRATPDAAAADDEISVPSDLTAGEAFTVAAPGVLANDSTDAPGTTLEAILDDPPPADAGAVALRPDGSFTFTPAGGFAGTTAFRYRATDGVTTSDPALVTVQATGPRRTPRQEVRLFAVGAGAGGGPRVRVFTTDGALRFDFLAFEPAFTGGVRVAVGDLTGDGIDDVTVAAGPGGGPRVAAFDGADGHRLTDFFAYEPTFLGGVAVAVGDVDGDGRADLVTGPGSGGRPLVRVLDPLGPTVEHDFFAYAPDFLGGVRVAAGDLSGDGRAEIVTAPGPSGGPHVRLFAGDGTPLPGEFFAFDPTYRGGAFVSVAAGADGPRIVVGPDSLPTYTGTALSDLFPLLPNTFGTASGQRPAGQQLGTAPRVQVFDFPSGLAGGVAVEEAFTALPPGFLGGVRVAAGRFRGQPGVYVGAGPGGLGRVQFFPFGVPAPTLSFDAFSLGLLSPSVYVAAGQG